MRGRKYIYLLLAGLGLAAAPMRAQQVGMYNHYFMKPLVYNPAFAGSGDNIQASLISRSQWTGFSGAPQLNIFTLDGAIKDKKAGLGLTLINETRGINRRNGGNISYSYRLIINDEAYVLLGLSAGVVNQSIDFSKALAENYSDPTLFAGMQQKTTFDGNAGFAFIWKGLELAAAAPQLFENRINYVDNSGIRTYYTQTRHYMSSLKYKFMLSEDKGISLAPQFLMRLAPGTPLQFDGNLNLDWADKFWLGGTYKSNYAISINAGIHIHKKLSIGYSYEFITADIGKYAGVSHEVFVNFKFGKKKKESNEDSLKAAENTIASKDSMYLQRIDSLQEALADNADRIRQLNKKLQEQAQLQSQTQAQIQALESKMQSNAYQPTNPQSNNTATNTQNNSSTAGNAQSNGNSSGGNTQTNNGSSKQNNSVANSGQTNTNSSGATNPTASNSTKTTNTSGGGETTNAQGTDPGVNRGFSALDMLDSKVLENEVWIATYPTTDFKNEKEVNPNAGYYIIVGTFFYRDFAAAETARFRKKGFPNCSWIYSETTKHNYIFTQKLSTKQEAIAKVKQLRQTSVKDAWVLQLK